MWGPVKGRARPGLIVEQLGEGGLATVYKSFQPALERMVALKALPHFFAGKADFRDLPVPGR